MNYLSKSLWGIILITLGVILGLNALEITSINLFFDGWWTLFIIVPSFVHLFDEKENKTSNLIGLGIGIVLLLACQNIIRFELILKLLVPFILVMIGISFLFGDKIKKKATEKWNQMNKDNLENIIATFSEQKVCRDNERLKDTNLEAIFGSITFDLREALFEKETVLCASSIFGSINILLPDDVHVEVKTTPIFGAISNKLRNQKKNNKTIYIDAFCLFGGIDIK